MTPEQFIRQRATNLIIGALAPFDGAARDQILDDATATLAFIDDNKAQELMNALRFAGMQGDITDEGTRNTLQTEFAQYVAEFVNPQENS